jgi:hypothetical protein
VLPWPGKDVWAIDEKLIANNPIAIWAWGYIDT